MDRRDRELVWTLAQVLRYDGDMEQGMLDTPGQQHLDREALGGYRLVRRLAAGGMAEVYEGRQRSLGDRPVAIKVVRADDEALASVPRRERVNVKDRFIEEGRLLARFAHPHILPIHDAGIDRGYLYLVMQFVPEGSLADAIRGRSPHPLRLPAPLPVVADIVSQLADALEYTHEHGVVHRDVKPSNVLVRTEPSGRRHVFLADFGIARSVESTAEAGKIVGTVAYMAPEQFSGGAVPASDQYALAALAYQLLTGRTPFAGTPAEQTYGHLYATPQPVRTLNPAVSGAVGAVIQRALAKQPADRYASVEAFAQALRTAIAAAPSGETTEPNAAGAPLAASASTRTAATLHHPDRVPTVKDPERQPTVVRLDRAGRQLIAQAVSAQRPIADTTEPAPPLVQSPAPPAQPAARRRWRLLAFVAPAAVLLIALVAAIASHGLGTSRGAAQATHSPAVATRPATAAGPTASSGSPAPAATSAPGTTPTAPPTAPPTSAASPATAATAAPMPPPTALESSASGDAATVTSLSTPATVAPGQRFSAVLMLTNAGTSTWTDAGGYRLICDTLRHPQQNCPRQLDVTLAGTTIAPGQTARFILMLVAPAVPGTYQAWINMGHDNLLFPSPDIALRVAVQPPTPTPATSPSPTASPAPTTTASPSLTPSPTAVVTSSATRNATGITASGVMPFPARWIH